MGMNRFTLASAIGLTALCSTAPVSAAGIAAGDFELRGSMSIISTETTDMGLVQAGIGYLFTDSLQFSLDTNLTTSTQPYVDFYDTNGDGIPDTQETGEESTTSGTLGFGFEYLLGGAEGSLVPFVGVAYTMNLADGPVTDFYAVRGGIKSFLTENAFIDVRYEFQGAVDSTKGGDQTLMLVGVGFYL